ncbi:MAG: cysteine desulfurase-like protein [Rhodocyclaceae bacterium]|nr:cysteine desulfurase-like protein [Rhodocyclaceae bacterium]MCA3026807.1 cysteine desulfurase-like protein [Rhodocyclaceae bacterium]MCA3028026.1 cysteine desulfurase-like protein [Rhodocyclaceae bacterium]MCA3032261.1 cysteine desulfurase-like protein [Rhodocyclaceae bacterium]MCA3037512.1 cysteine desulfurase-like protein [Rhodocyclaceae bacterium]
MTPQQLDAVRAEFPALATNMVFLDNAGGSQVLKRVADRIHDYLTTVSVQLGASYTTSVDASARVAAARRSVATLINAAHDEEVVMAGATTLLMFLFTQALRPAIRPGDEIIISNTDHESNIGGWMRLQEAGAVIKVWEVNRDTLELDLADLDNLLTSRTKWVAITHASNVIGTVNPIAEIANRVHAVGAKLCVDGVAYAPHRLVDVQASGADVYVFSFYKVFGPHYAVLWGKRDLLLSLPSLNHHFIGPDVLPYKLQPGNVNFELSYGCAGIGEYLAAMGEAFGVPGTEREKMQAAFDVFARHEDTLAELLLGYLRTKKNVRIIGRDRVTNGDRMPTISFVVDDKQSEAIVRHVDQSGIGIRFGDFYAQRLIDAIGIRQQGGVVRVSIAHYNSADEISRLIDALERFPI